MSKETRLVSLLLASAASLMLAIPSAVAQDGGPYGPPPGYNAGPPRDEGVIIVAPRFRYQPRNARLGVPPGTVSLSTRVSYSDLDLRTHGGARELRHRVRTAAAAVCNQIASAYPWRELPLSNCYRDAVGGGLGMAAARTNDVRVQARQQGYIFSD